MHFRQLISILFALGWMSISAATASNDFYPFQDSVLIHFRQSKTDFDTTYMDNSEALSHIRKSIDTYHKPDSNLVLLNVKVFGGASPEGSVRFNSWLSEQRASRIYDYMESHINMPDSITAFTVIGPDWEGLLSMVKTDPAVPSRNEVEQLLSRIIDKIAAGGKATNAEVLRLKRLHGGTPYIYLYKNLFPSLREAKVVLTFGRPLPPPPAMVEQPVVVVEVVPEQEIIITETIVEEEKPQRPFYMALKSNMVADLLALPEIGAEFYLGKNLSAVANWMYGWWDRDRTHRYWRAYGGDLALRWWFGRAAHDKPLTGHHLGIYGGVVTYDFEFGGKGHMGGRPGHNLWDRCMHYCGVEYGYSLPIARRINFDFTLGLGYMGGKYVEYHPSGKCYIWDATKQKHWFGPTKLEVSLVWLIGHGNFNRK